MKQFDMMHSQVISSTGLSLECQILLTLILLMDFVLGLGRIILPWVVLCSFFY